MWGLADCNNFFVSCERTRDKSLVGRPVVVLSNNDGCAIARSNEAKKLGVRMGQPAFELRDLIHDGKLIALSGDHLLYRNISLKVHAIIARFVPRTLDYSVDESFLDINGIPTSALPIIGHDIVSSCLLEADIPVTVGFSHTKTLAKIATESGKKSGISVRILDDPSEIENILGDMPIKDVWGIGRRLASKLAAEGVYSALQFSRRPVQWIRKLMGVNGEKTWRELNGEPCIDLSHIGRQLQDSISETRTFPQDESDYDYIRSRIIIYASDCARRLRAMRGRCLSVTVLLRTNRFHTQNGYFAPQAHFSFPVPVNDTNLIIEGAISALDSIYDFRHRYKRGGVILSDITAAECFTPSLFADIDGEKEIEKRHRPDLMKAIDNINREIGHPAIRLASQLVAGQPGHNDGYSSSFGAPSDIR